VSFDRAGYCRNSKEKITPCAIYNRNWEGRVVKCVGGCGGGEFTLVKVVDMSF
jgi:hypothetical protein